MNQKDEISSDFDVHANKGKDFKSSNRSISSFSNSGSVCSSGNSNFDVTKVITQSKSQSNLLRYKAEKSAQPHKLCLTSSLLKLDSYSDYCSKFWKDDTTLQHAEDFMFGTNGKMQNFKKAIKCFSIIKKKTWSSRALGLLGFCNEFGIGCKKNYTRCWDNYLMAELHEDALAMVRICDLGSLIAINESYQNFIYETLNTAAECAKKKQIGGMSTKNSSPIYESKNSKQELEFAQGPLKWLWWAANNCSNAYAQYALGNCFYYGAGTTHNIQLAIKWYWRSTLQGCGRAELSLGMCYLRGVGVKKNDKAAFRLLTQAVAKGETFAMYELGVCYEKGLIIPQNYDKARNLYVRATQKSHWPSATKLGNLYRDGIGVVRDLRHAAQWYHVARILSSAEAYFCLGEFYQKGTGVPQDSGIAFQCYQTAAFCFHKAAINALTLFYLCGIGTPRNPKLAAQWYLFQTDLNDGDAYVNFAWRLENGDGIPVDLVGALEMVDRAIMTGHEPQGVSLLDWATSLGMKISRLRIAQAAQQKIEVGMHSLASAV